MPLSVLSLAVHMNAPTLLADAPVLLSALQTNRFAIRKTVNMGSKRGGADSEDVTTDYTAKLLHLAWHPESNVIACAASNSLYMYCCA